MMKEITDKFYKLSENIKIKNLNQYRGIYQWNTKCNNWLFDIIIDDNFTCNVSKMSSCPDYHIYIENSDLNALVNKEIDPLGAINSGKLKIGFESAANLEKNKNHIQKLLHTIFNKGSIEHNIKSLLENLSPRSEELPDCPETTIHEEIEYYINIGSPCILRNSMSTNWKIYRMSEQDIINKVHDHDEITLLEGEHDPDLNKSAKYYTSTLSEYLYSIKKDDGKSPSYMAANSIPEPLHDCFEYPKYFDREAFNVPRWWIGPKNTGLGLHRDLIDNFLFQIKGKKIVNIYSPSESEYLYPVVFGGNPFYEPSSVNMHLPDLKKHPNFLKAKGIQCQLSPGDMLYLPAGWWHGIKNIDVSWSINFFAVNQKPKVLSKIIN